MTGLKYAMLLLPTLDSDQSRAELTQGLVSDYGRLTDCIDAEAITHWKEAHGTFAWREVERPCRYVLASTASESADVSDDENEALIQRTQCARWGLFMTPPRRGLYQRPWYLSGEAVSVSPLKLLSVRVTRYDPAIVSPFYTGRGSYAEAFPYRFAPEWIPEWQMATSSVAHAFDVGLPPILAVGLHSFGSGLTRTSMEFRIPEFVRAAESVLGIPKGPGRELFADRAIKIAPVLTTDPYIGGSEVRARLIDLYDRRSECVHGKIPFQDLHNAGEAGKEEVAKLEYLAEAVARACLRYVLEHPNTFPHFSSRSDLEIAWGNEAFPL